MILSTLASEFSAESSEVLERYIAKIAGGDKNALADLYYKTSSSVYGFALSVLKNTQDAEDVLHDSFINIFSAAGSYVPKGKPMAWILTVAKNLCYMKLRDRNKLSDLPQEDWEAYIEGSEKMSLEDKIVLRECMKTLSDKERQIIILHAVAGFKHREIASFLHLPLATVLSKHRRSLIKLKNVLEGGI